MAYDENLAARVRSALKRRKQIEEKKMFGGVGFLLNGNMCVGVWKEFLIVRLGKENHEDTMSEPHAKEFDITGKVMRGWAMVEPAGTKADDDLDDWVKRSAKYVGGLPPK